MLSLLAAVPAFAQAPKAAERPPRSLTIDPATMMQPWKGDLEGMIARRMIRVLTVPRRPPISRIEAGNAGDLRRVPPDGAGPEREAGEGEQTQAQVSHGRFFIPVRRDHLLPALVEGKGDIAAANVTVTPEREKLVDFAAPILTDVREVVLTGPVSGGGHPRRPRRQGGLRTQVLQLLREPDGSQSALRFGEEAAGDPEGGARATRGRRPDRDAQRGLVAIIVVDKHKADFWKQVFPKIKVHDDMAVSTGGEIAWAIRKDSPELKRMLDNSSRRPPRDRTPRTASASSPAISSAQVREERGVQGGSARSSQLIQFFQKYGDKYDVDWLLMAAQGYQESQLDQSARSPVGAIGVMQVMPATGKELEVGDITQEEPNINAGVKYMRYMIDQFYENEPMTKLDKALFAFASYNAGPGRWRSCARWRRNVASTPTSGSTTWSMSPRKGSGARPSPTWQHLQVLHRLPPDRGRAGATPGSSRISGTVRSRPASVKAGGSSARTWLGRRWWPVGHRRSIGRRRLRLAARGGTAGAPGSRPEWAHMSPGRRSPSAGRASPRPARDRTRSGSGQCRMGAAWRHPGAAIERRTRGTSSDDAGAGRVLGWGAERGRCHPGARADLRRGSCSDIASRCLGPVRSSRGEPDRDLRRPRHPERRERGASTSKVNDTDLSITRVTGRGDAGPKRPLGDTGILWSPIIEGGIGYGTFNNHFDDGALDGNKSTVTSLAVFLGGGVRFTFWEDWSLAPTFGIIYAHTENDFDARNEAGQNVLRLAGGQVNDLVNWSADTITVVPGMERGTGTCSARCS